MKVEDKLKSSVYFIEATDFEHHCLWKEYKNELDWEDDT